MSSYVRTDVKAHDKKRLLALRRAGYKVLVIWQKELRNEKEILRKVRKFHSRALRKG